MHVPGLAKRMSDLKKNGAGPAFIASAMMETDHMRVSEYPYGDDKKGAPFCAGLAKQNWYMARICGPKVWRGLPDKAYAKLAAINRDTRLDIGLYNRCRKHFNKRAFFARHRNGSSGAQSPNTEDIDRFIRGYDWTLDKVRKYGDRDCRYWVKIQKI